MPIKIIIADDHQLFREGLANLLSDSENIEIIAQVDSGVNAISKSKELNPDVVIMDIGMPGMDGIEATRKLVEELPEQKVIALSMHADKQYIKGMFEAGAAGYLFKNCNYTELTNAINSVHGGNKYMSNAITEIVIQDYLQKEEVAPVSENELTEREIEILKLIAEGVPVSGIADQLFVSVKTVGTHKQHILEKLDLKNTTDIVKYAIKKGIISLD